MLLLVCVRRVVAQLVHEVHVLVQQVVEQSDLLLHLQPHVVPGEERGVLLLQLLPHCDNNTRAKTEAANGSLLLLSLNREPWREEEEVTTRRRWGLSSLQVCAAQQPAGRQSEQMEGPTRIA